MNKVLTLPTAVLKTVQAFVIVFALLLVWAVMPMPARAAGLTDAQSQAVINLLSTFGADQNTLANVQLALKGASRDDILKSMGAGMASSSGDKGDKPHPGTNFSTSTWQGSASSTPGACVAFARRLQLGSSGSDVSNLQTMLEQTGDFKEGSTTGYFGPSTEAALKAWQAKQGIATSGDRTTTGFGATGPQTRGALLGNCMQLMKDRMGSGDNRGDGRFSSSTGTTTRRMPPMVPSSHTNTGGPSSMLAPLQQVSSLLVSGTAAVIDGYVSLFNLNF